MATALSILEVKELTSPSQVAIISLMSGLKDSVEDLTASYKKMAIVGNRQEKQEVEQAEPITEIQTPTQEPITANKSNIKIIKTTEKNYDTGQLSIFDLLSA